MKESYYLSPSCLASQDYSLPNAPFNLTTISSLSQLQPAAMCIHRSQSRLRRANYWWPPRVQVAGVSSLQEALFCPTVGVEALGFTLELPTGPHDGLTRAKAREIVLELPLRVHTVIITYVGTANEAHDLLTEVPAAAVQFHGGISEMELRKFRQLCAGIKTIGRVTVADESALNEAKSLEAPLWDAIILDSYDPITGKIGATGIAHDWSISARIVRESSLPVLLAGGLNPENVAHAVAMVRPSGVDAHSGLEDPDGKRSFTKIEAFSRAALDAFQRIQT